LKQTIEITEHDIYKFVFSPETLEPVKKTYLGSNLERFQRQIDYCRQLKSINIVETQEKAIINIVDKVIVPKIIELVPSVEPTESKDSKLRLAAKSLNLEKKNYSFSFTDTNSEHIIKIVQANSQNLLYFFSIKPIQKIKVTFFPSENSYTIQDTAKPIEILEESTINRIELLTQ